MFFLIYVVLTYPFSISACRKVWRLATNVGADSRLPSQAFYEAQNTISAVKNEYEQCNRDQILQCRHNATRDAAEESALLVDVHRTNMNKVDEAQQAQNQCRMIESTVRMTLHQNVVDNKDLPFIKNDVTCPAGAQMMIRKMAGADDQAKLLSLEELVTVWANNFGNQVNTTADYASERIRYDSIYFLGVFTEVLDSFDIRLKELIEVSLDSIFDGLYVDLLAGFQVFLTCIHEQEGSTVMCPVPSISVRIADFLQPLQAKLQFLANYLQSAVSTIQVLIDQYNSLRAAMQSLNIGRSRAWLLLHSCCDSFV